MALFASTQPPLQSFDAGACAAATLNSCLVACPTGAASLATASGAIVGVEGLEHAQTQLLKAAGPGAVAHAWSADGGCVTAAARRGVSVATAGGAATLDPVGEVKDVAVRALPDGAYEVAVGTFAGVELFTMTADGAAAPGVILGEGRCAVKVAHADGGGVVAAFLDGVLARLPGDAFTASSWTLALPDGRCTALAVSGDLGAAASWHGGVLGFDARTGAARFAVAGAAGEPAPRALAVRNRAVAVAGDGLAAFYDDAGAELGRRTLDPPTVAGLCCVGPRLLLALEARDDKAPRAAEPRRCRLARLDWPRPRAALAVDPARLAKLEARLQGAAPPPPKMAPDRLAKLEARLQGATIAGAAPPAGFETPGKAAGPATFDAPPPPPP